MKLSILTPVIALLPSIAHAFVRGTYCCEGNVNWCKATFPKESVGCVHFFDKAHCVMENKDDKCENICKDNTKDWSEHFTYKTVGYYGSNPAARYC
ncbi:hypothetical protein FKW77_008631 [Venturia effusa]|uniref:Extracellular membrane protein CFEM domain-containing protein n=1 Tax=Venturia effusa TaxID=50376 RepID=A0A517L7V7_9PEZI|nr:hypothetical protein FKW77_008631 [Venturia effusa]